MTKARYDGTPTLFLKDLIDTKVGPTYVNENFKYRMVLLGGANQTVACGYSVFADTRPL